MSITPLQPITPVLAITPFIPLMVYLNSPKQSKSKFNTSELGFGCRIKSFIDSCISELEAHSILVSNADAALDSAKRN